MKNRTICHFAKLILLMVAMMITNVTSFGNSNCTCPNSLTLDMNTALSQASLYDDRFSISLPLSITLGSEMYDTLQVTHRSTKLILQGPSSKDYEFIIYVFSMTDKYIVYAWMTCGTPSTKVEYLSTTDADDLEAINSLIRCTQNEAAFTGTFAYVSVWTDVNVPSCSASCCGNTFESIIITNGTTTYLVQNFIKLTVNGVAGHGIHCESTGSLSRMRYLERQNKTYLLTGGCEGVFVSLISASTCAPPGAGVNVTSSPPEQCHYVGTTVTYTCIEGHAASDGALSKTLSCLSSGFWDGEELICEDIDECESSPCKHGGSCVDKIANYNCTCAAGYTGNNCEQDCRVCFHCEASRDMEECERIGSYKPCTSGNETKATATCNGQNGAHVGHTADNYCPETPQCITQYHNRGNNKRVEMYCLKDACIHKSFEIKLNEKCCQTRKGSPKCIEVNNPECKPDEL